MAGAASTPLDRTRGLPCYSRLLSFEIAKCLSNTLPDFSPICQIRGHRLLQTRSIFCDLVLGGKGGRLALLLAALLALLLLGLRPDVVLGGSSEVARTDSRLLCPLGGLAVLALALVAHPHKLRFRGGPLGVFSVIWTTKWAAWGEAS
jgi:hypothetical protein